MRLATIVLLSIGSTVSGQGSALNLSTDLTRLGIAPQNMEPDRRDLDSRPLFNAGLDYVKSRGIRSVTLNPGAYYFLTPRQGREGYVLAVDLQDVTFDFNGATLYFRDALVPGFNLFNARRVTLQRLTLDLLDLPFTQVRITGGDPANRVVRYELLPGFRDPAEFNADWGAVSQNNPEMHALAYRDGQLLPNTGRSRLAVPLEPGFVRFTDANNWTTPQGLSGLRGGDILVVLLRTQNAIFNCQGCVQVSIRDVDVHASASIGITMVDATDSLVERVRVVPRRESGRLISTLADGIALFPVRARNTVRNCEVRGTGDDGISVHSEAQVFVDAADRFSVVGQPNWKYLPLSVGAMVSFVDASTGADVGTARVTAVDPPPVMWSRTTTRFTFDRAIPVLPRDSLVVLDEAAERGEGTIVESNLIADQFMARGIVIEGGVGVTVRNNTILRSTGAGVQIDGNFHPRGFSTPAAKRIDVVGNRVEDAIRPYGDIHTGTGNALGAMAVTQFQIPPGGTIPAVRSNQQIRFIGNVISGSGRSGIWVSNAGDVTIQGNTIVRSGLFASAPIVGFAAAVLPQLRLEFAKDICRRQQRQRRERHGASWSAIEPDSVGLGNDGDVAVDRPDHTDGASHIRRRSGIGYRTRGSRHVFHWQLSNRARRTGRAAWSLLRPDSRGQCCRIRAAIERSGRRRRLRSELTSCSAR